MAKQTMTPEAFCWLYAAGCVEAREQQALMTDEHLISQGYFADLRRRVDEGEVPSDDVIRRVFTRPFDLLGKNCTLEEMKLYWRVKHRNPTEKTPVFMVQIAPYTKKMYPRVDREGMWWETRIFDSRKKQFERMILHNVHRYTITPDTLTPGAWVFAHVTVTGSDAMYGIIAEIVSKDAPVYRAFAY